MNRPKVNFKPEAWVNIDELQEHPKNPRIDLTSNPDKFENLKQSILEGVFEPVKVSKLSGFCLAGNQRLKAFRDLGYDEVPVQYNEYETEADEIRDMIKDNNEWGSYVYSVLEANINEFGLNVDTLGLTEIDLEKIDIGKDEKEAREDDVPEAPKVPKTKRGDIFQLGNHRLMCGDSTDLKDIESLMAGGKADMVFTDPPYNVNYSGRGEKTSNKILNDNMSVEAFQEFLKKTFEAYKSAVKISAPFYVCHSSSSQRSFEDAMELIGLKVKCQIIWNKTVASMGWGDYRWKHEPIFYATFDGKATNFYGDRCNYTVWNESWDIKKMEAHLKKIADKQEKGGSTVWTISREREYDHPTQKPIELIEIALANSSKQEDIVLDLFGGSGSTMIACEKANRACFTMELDPKYCDVIIERWENYSEQKAKKL